MLLSNLCSAQDVDSLNQAKYFANISFQREYSIFADPYLNTNSYFNETSLGSSSNTISLTNGIKLNKWNFGIILSARKIKETKNASFSYPIIPYVSKNVEFNVLLFNAGIQLSRIVYETKHNEIGLSFGLTYAIVPEKVNEDERFNLLRESDSSEVRFIQKARNFKSTGYQVQFGLIHTTKTKIGDFGIGIHGSIIPTIFLDYSIKQDYPNLGFSTKSSTLNRGFMGFGLVYSWSNKN
jgi:hemolysin activation/secretion protein